MCLCVFHVYNYSNITLYILEVKKRFIFCLTVYSQSISVQPSTGAQEGISKKSYLLSSFPSLHHSLHKQQRGLWPSGNWRATIMSGG